jgi:hypothetical protein
MTAMPLPLKDQPTKLRVHALNQARVQILQAESIGPMDRKAIRKGHDRAIRRRSDLILVEFF